MGRGGDGGGRVRKLIRGTAHYAENAGHTQGRFGSGTNNRWRGVSVFKKPGESASRKSLGNTTITSTYTFQPDFGPYMMYEPEREVMRKVLARRELDSGYAKRRKQRLVRRQERRREEEDEVPFYTAHDPTICAEMARRMNLRSAPSECSRERIAGWSDAFAFPHKDAKSNAARPPCKPTSPLSRRRLCAGMPVDNEAPPGFVDRKYVIQQPPTPPKPKDALYFKTRREQRKPPALEKPRKLPNLRQKSRVSARQSPRLVRDKHRPPSRDYVREHVDHRFDAKLSYARTHVKDHASPRLLHGDHGHDVPDFVAENARGRLAPDLDQDARVDDHAAPGVLHHHRASPPAGANPRGAAPSYDRARAVVDDRGGKIVHHAPRDFVGEKVDAATDPNLLDARAKVEDRVDRAMVHLCNPTDHDYVHENAHPTVVSDRQVEVTKMQEKVSHISGKLDEKKKLFGVEPAAPRPPPPKTRGYR